MILLKDNTPEIIKDMSAEEQELMTTLSGRSLNTLIEENEILTFPNSFQAGDGDQYVLTTSRNQDTSWQTQTYNLVGFIGKGDAEIRINTRFDVDGHYNFLHYLLLKTQNINLFRYNVKSNRDDSMFDLLKFIFPKYLKEALSSGLLKMYDSFDYNDCKLKGHIDVNRHIKLNQPFMGHIAYHLREHTCDNHIIHLICYCIDYLQKDEIGRLLLKKDELTKRNVKLVQDLGKSYRKYSLNQTINRNLKTPIHPLYVKYRPLQKLCLALLRHRHISYNGKADKVHGVLFDAAWLWEEYVGLEEIKHLSADRASAIYYKTIMYMYRFQANKGLLLYPRLGGDAMKEYKIIGTNGSVVKIPMKVSGKEAFPDFASEMKLNEKEFYRKAEGMF